MTAGPNPENQRIIDRLPPEEQPNIFTPIEDALINRRYRTEPPATLPDLAAELGIPRTTLINKEMQAVLKALRFNLRNGY